ncbi:MAG: hypothetical protein EOO09_01605 [Chitinophagaceae bacterium]|nr:MAG: hypothetical protein EOO09_01605 [Chitinophagaceae bacterium]
MRKIVRFTALLCLLVLCTVDAFSQKQFDTPLAMNDYLVSHVDSLFILGTDMGNALGTGVKKKDFSGLAATKTAIVRYGAAKQAEIRKVKDQFGSEDFRKGILDFLEFEMDLMKTKTTLMDKLHSQSTDAEIQAAIDQMIAESKREEEYLRKIGLLQEQFAKKNGITLAATE